MLNSGIFQADTDHKGAMAHLSRAAISSKVHSLFSICCLNSTDCVFHSQGATDRIIRTRVTITWNLICANILMIILCKQTLIATSLNISTQRRLLALSTQGRRQRRERRRHIGRFPRHPPLRSTRPLRQPAHPLKAWTQLRGLCKLIRRDRRARQIPRARPDRISACNRHRHDQRRLPIPMFSSPDISSLRSSWFRSPSRSHRHVPVTRCIRQAPIIIRHSSRAKHRGNYRPNNKASSAIKTPNCNGNHSINSQLVSFRCSSCPIVPSEISRIRFPDSTCNYLIHVPSVINQIATAGSSIQTRTFHRVTASGKCLRKPASTYFPTHWWSRRTVSGQGNSNVCRQSTDHSTSCTKIGSICHKTKWCRRRGGLGE